MINNIFFTIQLEQNRKKYETHNEEFRFISLEEAKVKLKDTEKTGNEKEKVKKAENRKIIKYSEDVATTECSYIYIINSENYRKF